MPRLYTTPTVLSGESVVYVDDVLGGGYGGLATVAGESCSLLAASCVLAASVIIWEACAFVALAAVLVAGATWCLTSVVAAAAGRPAAAGTGTAFPTAAARASRVVCCGLAEIDISALPKSPYQQQHRPAAAAGGGGDGVTTCAVCLEDLRGGEMVRSLPECRHLFHVGCIDAWLQMHVTCPLCRSDLSPRRRVTTAAPVPVGSQAESWSPQ
ncbi:hypothetical protein BDA96_04G118700 [Sorghum bicolor]|uniref:RING-type E3 ubiquitin transferase n=1 Tax=Sorghum bicolor TaxID=4558 RepID=A0A921UHT0_SORBI|nr:hypothetical protein BDA96_04G118700 [Sorghum bicolor]